MRHSCKPVDLRMELELHPPLVWLVPLLPKAYSSWRQGLVFQTSAGRQAAGRRGKNAALGPSSLHPPGQRGREERGSKSAHRKLLKRQISLQIGRAPPHPDVQLGWSCAVGAQQLPTQPRRWPGCGLPALPTQGARSGRGTPGWGPVFRGTGIPCGPARAGQTQGEVGLRQKLGEGLGA